jgi:hypothetical protein
MRQEVLDGINDQFNIFDKVFRAAHNKQVIDDAKLLKLLNEVSQLKTHLIEVIDQANKEGK